MSQLDNCYAAIATYKDIVQSQREDALIRQAAIARRDQRISDLLAANNSYLQRARDAEATVKRLQAALILSGERLLQVSQADLSIPDAGWHSHTENF